MKINFFVILFLFSFIFSCNKDEFDLKQQQTSAVVNFRSDDGCPDLPEFQLEEDIEVFFAQTHVLKPNSEYFGLVSGKSMLIKVHLKEELAQSHPEVTATLDVNGTQETIILRAPTDWKNNLDFSPGNDPHTFEDSYTATINGNYIQAGLTIRVEAGDKSVVYDNLTIGAPNRMVMQMFDIHYFRDLGENTEGDAWRAEAEAKLPVSELDLRRIKAVFPELTYPPRAGFKAIRLLELNDYWDTTGVKIDGEQDAAIHWGNALQDAAGTRGRRELFFVNYYGNPRASGGRAPLGGYAAVCKGVDMGSRFHELGHALNLPHWHEDSSYPYKGSMCGIQPPTVAGGVHIGPIWAYDLNKGKFISPRITRGGYKGKVGQYKTSPMAGGGSATQDHGYNFNQFSEYGVDIMRKFMQDYIVVWNDQPGVNSYASWNPQTNSYSNLIPNNEVHFPVEREVEVFSVMAGVSSTTPQANIVYPPIGPYISGMIRLFDPYSENDRNAAAEKFCPAGGCDISVRVVQGGISKVYMLALEVDESLDPTDPESFKTKAINLHKDDGYVTKIELLSTPNAEQTEPVSNPPVLYTWEKE